MNNTELIDHWIQNTCQKKCWCIGAGGCTGTAFTMYYGDKIPRETQVTNEMLAVDCRKYHSDFFLFVHSAMWKLGTDQDGIVRRVTDARDDHSPDGAMVQGLQTLVGNTIARASFDPVRHDLDIYFQDDFARLKVFGNVREGSLGYSLYSPEHIVTIQRDHRIDVFVKS